MPSPILRVALAAAAVLALLVAPAAAQTVDLTTLFGRCPLCTATVPENFTNGDAGPSFYSACLIFSAFEDATLDGYDLEAASFCGSNFTTTSMSRVTADLAEFTGSFMTGVDLTRGSFRYADFTAASLDFVNGSNADFFGVAAPASAWRRSFFRSSSFENTNADRSFWTGSLAVDSSFANCTLTGAVLNDANFSTSSITGTNAQQARLESSFFIETVFRATNLRWALLNRSTFTGATFNLVDAYNTDCSTSVFNNADLRGSVFTWANFAGSSLAGADLRNSTFYYANMQSVNFTETTMTGAQFFGVSGLPGSGNCEEFCADPLRACLCDVPPASTEERIPAPAAYLPAERVAVPTTFVALDLATRV